MNGGPGVFDETWTFSQELADANAAADAQNDSRDQAQRRHDWFRNRSSQWAAQPDPSTLADVVQLCTVMLLDFERIETQLADLVIASGSYDPNDQDPTGQTRSAETGDGLPGEPPAWAIALRELIEGDDFYGPLEKLNYAHARYFCLYMQEQRVLRDCYRKVRAEHGNDPSGGKAVAAVLADRTWDELDADFRRWVRGFLDPDPGS